MSLVLPANAFVDTAHSRELSIVEAEWADEVRGPDDYDLNPEGVFERGVRAYAYLEVEGFTVGQIDELYTVDLRVDVVLRTRGGLRLFGEQDLVSYEWKDEILPPENVWFYVWVDVPSWAPRATYLAEVVIRDTVGGQTSVKRREIRVE